MSYDTEFLDQSDLGSQKPEPPVIIDGVNWNHVHENAQDLTRDRTFTSAQNSARFSMFPVAGAFGAAVAAVFSRARIIPWCATVISGYLFSSSMRAWKKVNYHDMKMKNAFEFEQEAGYIVHCGYPVHSEGATKALVKFVQNELDAQKHKRPFSLRRWLQDLGAIKTTYSVSVKPNL